MKSILILALFMIALILFSCKAPSVLLNEALRQSSDVYPVSGRMGLQIKQKISFGPYRTTVVKRGWISSYNIPFVLRFSGAKEKLAFTISDSGSTATLHCLGKISQTELQLVRDWFGIALKQEDAFAGNVSLSPDKNWDFIIYNASNTSAGKPVYGHAQMGGERIFIHGIRSMEGQNTWLSSFGIYGYEFVQNNKVIGTVETLNRGRVILEKSADAETRLLVSALSCALLLKTDLEDPGRHNVIQP